MSYCLNPACTAPQNSDSPQNFDLGDCRCCGSALRLQNRYFAVKPIAHGGFGRTFLAVDAPSKNRCIIKQFFPQQQGIDTLEKASQLFRQEAQRLQKLGSHCQIPALLAYIEQAGCQYLVQEFIDGRTLAQELAEDGAFDELQIWQLLKDLLPVMEFIHSHRVIHRDIKPANIIRDRSTQKLFLVDLGAAKHATGSALAFTGTIIGSAEYTAPEQTRGKAVFASDLYSLGATCIHLLTQLSPFDLYDVSDGQWVWQDYLQSSVSPSLTQILNKLLENTTNRRYPSAIAVLSDLSKEDLSKFTPSVSYAHPLIEDWDVIAEKTAYQLGIHLSFKEAEALVKSTRSEIASQYRSSSFLKTSHRSKDLAFPAMLLLLTLPVFCWCVARSSSPPPQILRERIAPEYSDSIEPPLHF